VGGSRPRTTKGSQRGGPASTRKRIEKKDNGKYATKHSLSNPLPPVSAWPTANFLYGKSRFREDLPGKWRHETIGNIFEETEGNLQRVTSHLLSSGLLSFLKRGSQKDYGVWELSNVKRRKADHHCGIRGVHCVKAAFTKVPSPQTITSRNAAWARGEEPKGNGRQRGASVRT